ncbi:Reverse transcriptase zinc-binding domain-containing protein [Dioscorea alata]|uniref:Reverse transcriptase zinc-binding domain-containing protein n=1 Tax=Dioscorea alata TaxID=55571 RepID=A0ACB7WT00_DIOAL|nr:Reverse transcriptase zinc-binding domain-containing protein [Dioscorea alata]
MNLKPASFPFKYLGILIFKHMVDSIRHTCSRWSNFNLSSAAKATLINYSSLLSIPIYTFSVYTMPDLILSEITKLVQKFYWSRGGNGTGIHNVNWSTVIEGKPEGGIGIKNLSLAKHSLMAKHVFKYLNNVDFLWVDILHLKYGRINFWMNSAPSKCSWFFKCLFNTASRIKPFCRISSINPANTSFFWDPWCFDVPLAFKPTFLNMHVDLNQGSISDLLLGDHWNEVQLNHIFGSNFNLHDSRACTIDNISSNHWIWNPVTKRISVSATVYNHLNHSTFHHEHWPRWHLLWKIHVVPRVKHFLWVLFHGRLSTSNYLYLINLGPNSPCAMCGLAPETIDHLFYQCSKAQWIWSQLSLRLNAHIQFPCRFSSGSWLSDGTFSKYIISTIAATAWLLWKTRCDVIFGSVTPNLSVVITKALAHVQEYSTCNSDLLGWRLFLNDFSIVDGQFLFSRVSINPATKVRSIGFFFLTLITSYPVQDAILSHLMTLHWMICSPLRLGSKSPATFKLVSSTSS